MREALFITATLILLFLLIGVMYSIMSPYLLRLGVVDQGDIAELRSDGGIFRSLDFAHSWQHAAQAIGSAGLSRSNVRHIAFSPERSVAYAATSKGFYKTNTMGSEWEKIYSGDLDGTDSVQFFAQDLRNSNRLYLASYDGTQGYILKSRGGDFYEVYATSKEGDKVLGIWVDPADSTTLYASTQEGLFLESADFGESWRIRRNFGDALSIVISRNDSKIMYAIAGKRKVFRSNDRGKSWKDISAPLAVFGPDTSVNQLVIDPKKETRIYIASSNGFLKSENRGEKFFKIKLLTTEESPNISTVAVDPQRPEVIYLGIKNQIHKSDDGGKSWQVKTLDTARTAQVIRVNPYDSKKVFVGVQQ